MTSSTNSVQTTDYHDAPNYAALEREFASPEHSLGTPLSHSTNGTYFDDSSCSEDGDEYDTDEDESYSLCGDVPIPSPCSHATQDIFIDDSSSSSTEDGNDDQSGVKVHVCRLQWTPSGVFNKVLALLLSFWALLVKRVVACFTRPANDAVDDNAYSKRMDDVYSSLISLEETTKACKNKCITLEEAREMVRLGEIEHEKHLLEREKWKRESAEIDEILKRSTELHESTDRLLDECKRERLEWDKIVIPQITLPPGGYSEEDEKRIMDLYNRDLAESRASFQTFQEPTSRESVDDKENLNRSKNFENNIENT